MEGILIIRIGIGGLWNLLGGIAQSLTLGGFYGDGSSGGGPAAVQGEPWECAGDEKS